MEIEYLFLPKDASSLAVIRILFGLLMMADIIQERGGSKIDIIWGHSEDCHFPLFSFVKPLHLEYMCIIYGILWICALFISIGFHYKKSCFIFTIIYWYLILLDKSYWNNHTYLYGLIGILLTASSANYCWSFDAAFKKDKPYPKFVPQWNYLVIKFQFFILYFYAGLKKTDLEWLSGYSMRHLGYHWVFDPFKLFFTVPQVDYLIIHISGFLIDLSSGFLLIFEKSRPVGILINASFNIMNSRLFNIGMFPYVCLACLPIFCEENWPRKIMQHFKATTTKYRESNKETKNMNNHDYIFDNKKSTTALILIYCLIQLILPFSHFITKGYNNWTQGLYGYSWDMMVHRWDGALTVVKILDHDSGQEYHLDPSAWTRNERWSKHGDMCVQYAECVKRNIARDKSDNDSPSNKFSTSTNISIYINVWCSLNGRFQQRMFNPNYDLLKANWSPFTEVEWLKPLLTDYNDFRERIVNIQEEVYNWSNHSDVMIIADFPGLHFDNYISSDLSNVTLTVLDGDLYYETEADTKGLHLKSANILKIPTDTFHKLTTVSKTPSCFMYTYFNKNVDVVSKSDENNSYFGNRKLVGENNSPFPILENRAEMIEEFSDFFRLVYGGVLKVLFDVPMSVRKR